MTCLEMHVDRRRDSVVLRLSGEFDLTCKRDFEARSREVLAQRFRKLVLDLSGVSFIDSTGLGLILELWSGARRDGWELAVVRAPERVHQTFETAGLDRALPIIESVPEETRAETL